MDKVAVISGATKGIGLACANMFSKEGYKVYCLSHNEPENYEYEFIKCDVTNPEDIKNAFEIIDKKELFVDVVLCNAGKGIGGPLENTELSQAKDLFDVNFFGAFNLAKAFIPKFKKQKFGKILFMSSVGSIFPLPFQAFYSASKSAVETMANAWRIELAPFNIQVGCILPGDAHTSFTEKRQNVVGDESYNNRDVKSIKKMEKDEINGMSPNKIADAVRKAVNKKKLPIRVIVGGKYKIFAFLNKILPQKFVLWMLGKMYGWYKIIVYFIRE